MADSIKSTSNSLMSAAVAALSITLLLGFGALMLYNFNKSANGTITSSVNFLTQNIGLIGAALTMIFIAVMIKPMIAVIGKLKSIFGGGREEE